MNVQSNLYTFIYATIMVVVVALGLAFTSISLKDKQDANVEKEKKQNILSSIGVECSREEAVELYKKHVKSVYAINVDGNKIDGVVDSLAFKIELNKEQAKDLKDRQFPVYECEKDGENLFVIPVRGKGLWGPVWGYIALKDDFNTISGVNFDHKGETPGLGAEITTKEFQTKFIDKKIFDKDNKFVSISLMKPGKSDGGDHQIDGLSGATLTCNGVQNMIFETLSGYEKFFKSQQ